MILHENDNRLFSDAAIYHLLIRFLIAKNNKKGSFRSHFFYTLS